MDLSFPPFTQDHELHAWPAELAMLLLGLTARQGESATAGVQAGLEPEQAMPADPLLAPESGSFNGAVATEMQRWRKT